MKKVFLEGKMKKKLKMIVMAMFAITVMMVSTKTVNAYDYIKYTVDHGISDMDKSLAYVGTCNTAFAVMSIDGVTDFTISSSDEAVCRTELCERDGKYTSVDFTYIMPGKVTLTATYNYKGKSYTNKARIKVVNYSSPFKSLKLGKKNITKCYDEKNATHYGRYGYGYAKVSGKQVIKCTLKKGYKMYQNPTFQMKANVKKSITYKKNAKVNLSKVDYIHFYIKDKEGYKTIVAWGNRKPDKY
jgi:hypothetical protein